LLGSSLSHRRCLIIPRRRPCEEKDRLPGDPNGWFWLGAREHGGNRRTRGMPSELMIGAEGEVPCIGCTDISNVSQFREMLTRAKNRRRKNHRGIQPMPTHIGKTRQPKHCRQASCFNSKASNQETVPGPRHGECGEVDDVNPSVRHATLVGNAGKQDEGNREAGEACNSSEREDSSWY
jgi:hypothetical protein